MRLGLIGLGRIGALHAQTLADLDVVDAVVVTDQVPGVAERVASGTGASVAPSAAALLASGVDGVVIASSTPTHLGLIRAAVRAGVPTFCEKPVTEDPRVAAGLADERNNGDAFIEDLDDVDTAAVLLTLDDGTIALVSNTRYNGSGYDVRLELHGSRGAVAAGLDEGLPLRSAERGVTFPAGPSHTFFVDRLAEAFAASLLAFTEVVAGDRPSPCTFSEGLEATWIAEACHESRRQHRPLRMEEVR